MCQALPDPSFNFVQNDFPSIYFYNSVHEPVHRRGHTSSSTLNGESLQRAQDAIHKPTTYTQQVQSAIEYVAQDGSANELKMVLTTRMRGVYTGFRPAL
ncbi:unnamed protein product [Lota lota]